LRPPSHSLWRCLRALRAKKITVFALTNFGMKAFDYAVILRFLEEFDAPDVSGAHEGHSS